MLRASFSLVDDIPFTSVIRQAMRAGRCLCIAWFLCGACIYPVFAPPKKKRASGPVVTSNMMNTSSDVYNVVHIVAVWFI